MLSLVLDESCRRIARHLTAAGQPFIMLKGATIAGWLYPDPSQRTYVDLDVLVPPADEERVVALFAEIGFSPLLSAGTRDLLSPEEQPLRNGIGVDVDLHTALKGVRLPREEAWPILWAATESWDWAGTPVPALAPPARALHLALHLAQNGLADGKAAQDLRLGIARVEHETWTAAAELADRLRATDAFTAGLTALPEGAELADRLGLAALASVEYRMRAASVFPPAARLERLLAERSWRRRAATLRAYLFPSADWLRMHDPRATTPWGLVRARAGYAAGLLPRAVRAVRERRRFRRAHAGG